LEAVARGIIEANPGPAADFRAGKQKAFGFLMGQLMKATKGKANPKLATEILQRALAKSGEK